MLSEESLEEYQREKRIEFIKSISQILVFTLVPLTFFYFCKNLHFQSNYSLSLFLFVLLFSILSFSVRFYLVKRNLVLPSVFISFPFLFISIITIFLSIPTSVFIISLVISFTILLLCLGEKEAFKMLLFFLFVICILIFLQSREYVRFSFSDLSIHGSHIYYQIKSYWLLSFLLFLLYKGCLMTKDCNTYSKICVEKYKYLAKLEYKHRLVGKISKCLIHDICTPLSVLSGSIRVMERAELSNKEISKVKKSALNSLQYLENILDNSFMLLKDSNKKRKFSGNSTVKKILVLIQSRLKVSKITVKVNLCNSQKIFGNESLFARAVLNILINSIEELEMNKKERKIIEITSKVINGVYILKVKDNGRGIRKSVLKDIEKREISMKGGEHLGLGFYFVLDTVKNHFKGSLEIESVKGKSTTIIFKIPVRDI